MVSLEGTLNRAAEDHVPWNIGVTSLLKNGVVASVESAAVLNQRLNLCGDTCVLKNASHKLTAALLSSSSSRSLETSDSEPLMGFLRMGCKAHSLPGCSDIARS